MSPEYSHRFWESSCTQTQTVCVKCLSDAASRILSKAVGIILHTNENSVCKVFVRCGKFSLFEALDSKSIRVLCCATLCYFWGGIGQSPTQLLYRPWDHITVSGHVEC